MERKPDVDALIREALSAEGVDRLEGLGEPGFPEMVTDLFRSRLRWYGALFLAMILVFSVLTGICTYELFETEALPELIRWGVGLLLCVSVALSGKIWYWMQMEHLATAREIKRVELLVAQLVCEVRKDAPRS